MTWISLLLEEDALSSSKLNVPKDRQGKNGVERGVDY